MPQGWSPLAPDQRTYADLLARILDDINRPDLANIAQSYSQDAIRYYQRKPFFFNDTDNTQVPGWQANTFYTQGATLSVQAIDMSQIAVVNLIAGLSGNVQPAFDPTIYVPPTNLTSPPVFTPGPGTSPDNQALWATVAPFQVGIYAQLSTVPFQNQYVPPLDYIAPRRVEVTWAGNLRIGMTYISYDELRNYDVIRPTPPASYPEYWTFYQQQLYFWPYPTTFQAITLSYRTAPPLPINATDSNFWTTSAEGLIRYWADARIAEGIIGDQDAAGRFYDLAKQELAALVGQRIQQDTAGEGDGIPASPW